MDRRRVVIAFAIFGSVFTPCFTGAQPQSKVWRVGFLGNDPTIPATPAGKAFREGLRERGFVEGKNIVIEWRFAEGKIDILTVLARELVRLDLDLIVASSGAAAVAVKKSTQKIPIVMINVADPVGLGIVSKLGAGEGNVTGLANDVSAEITGKRLQLLKGAVPKVARIAVLMNPESPSDTAQWDVLQRVAPSLGVTLEAFPVRQGSEFATAFVNI